MVNMVTHVSLLVRDQEEAKEWYVSKLGFRVASDQQFPDGAGRWLTIAPPNQQELEIVLQPATWGPDGSSHEERAAMIGKQPGWVITSDDCHGDYERLSEQGVTFTSAPVEMPWGISAVFVDLYGVSHNLLQPR